MNVNHFTFPATPETSNSLFDMFITARFMSLSHLRKIGRVLYFSSVCPAKKEDRCQNELFSSQLSELLDTTTELNFQNSEKSFDGIHSVPLQNVKTRAKFIVTYYVMRELH
jgi:hypothetical protein